MRSTHTLAVIVLALAAAGAASAADTTPARDIAYGKLRTTMDASDKQKATEAVRSGADASWKNESSGTDYTVQNKRTYERASQTCRDYQIAATKSGNTEQVNASACKQADGGWNSGQ